VLESRRLPPERTRAPVAVAFPPALVRPEWLAPAPQTRAAVVALEALPAESEAATELEQQPMRSPSLLPQLAEVCRAA
jgi:hypothetical protein